MKNLLKFLFKYSWLIIAVIISLAFFDWDLFIKPIQDIIAKPGSGLPGYIEDNQIVYVSFLRKVIDWLRDIIQLMITFKFTDFVFNIITWMLDFMVYFINIGVNLMLVLFMLFYMFISKEVDAPIKSKGAILYIKFQIFLVTCVGKIKEFLQFLYLHRMKIFLMILIWVFSRGLLFKIIIETLFFLFDYLLSIIQATSHILLFRVIQAAIIFIITDVPGWMQFVAICYFIWHYSVWSARNKLQRNYEALKVIVKYELSQSTFVNGPPSVGKTRSMVAMAIAAEENYIDELEEIQHQIEYANPDVNFGAVVKDEVTHGLFPDHQEVDVFLNRGSFIISGPFGINDPIADEMTKILDYDYIRKNIKSDVYPLENYTVIVISELDKEYNSHDNKKEVGEDGVHLFFSTVSHDLERHVKVFADYQLKDQVPLRVRGNAEKIIQVKDSVMRYPFLLGFFKLPFDILYRSLDFVLTRYESYKLFLSKWSTRRSPKIRKRYDYVFLYSVFRFMMFHTIQILSWFDKFYYTKYTAELLTNDGDNKRKLKYAINSMDEEWRGQRLYDSTFLSTGYKQRKNTAFKDLPRWSAITPTIEEMQMLNSKFVNNGILLPKENKKEKESEVEMKSYDFSDFK